MVLNFIHQPFNGAVRSAPTFIDRNMRLIDTTVGSQGVQTYNPNFRAVQGTAQPNVGTEGAVEGWWYSVLGIVYSWGSIRWRGTGVAPGSGNNRYLISLPVPFRPTQPRNDEPFQAIGTVHCRDNSSVTASDVGCVERFGNSLIEASFNSGPGHSVRFYRFDVPFTWAVNDDINWSVQYPGAL